MLKTNFKKIAVALLAIAAAGYVAICVYFYFKQGNILFPTKPVAADFKYTFAIPFEEVWIDVDGGKLNGLYYPAEGESKGLILFFHGNGDNAAQFGNNAKVFTSRGYDYFIPDYRGYGKSPGRVTSEAQFLSDIDRIYEWARKKYPEEKIVFGGRSLGGAPAAYLASKHNPKVTVLVASFFNVAAMKNVRYPFLPDFILKYTLPNNRWVAQSKRPIYFVHGTEDKTVPKEQSMRLSELATAQHNHFTVPGAGHNNLQDFPVYHEILYQILDLDN